MEATYVVVFTKKRTGLVDAFSGSFGKGNSLEDSLIIYKRLKESAEYRNVILTKYCEVVEEVVYKIKE